MGNTQNIELRARAQQLAAPAAGTTEQLRASAFDDAPVPD